MNKLQNYFIGLNSLVIFRNLSFSPVMQALSNLLECAIASNAEQSDFAHPEYAEFIKSTSALKLYTEFVFELYQSHDNISDYICDFIMDDENYYIKAIAKGLEPGDMIESALTHELLFLQNLSQLNSVEIQIAIQYDDFLPLWRTSKLDIGQLYIERLNNISKHGFGIFSKHHMFTISGERIVPVKCPDPQLISELISYEREREIVIKNTQTLIDGGKASNLLLYGDAGTGKSSTIKAVVNHFKNDGLRLIEVKKHQLFILPDILEQLAENPLKFIVFIDDLSFLENDDNFTSLKALLEGSVSAISQNVVIYATSNRRHLVKESFSDRSNSDEIHVNDTLQEISSLAARFGLTITFDKPNKDIYLSIATELAKTHGISVDEQFLIKAEAFALRANGRSPRAAKQFVGLFKSGI